MNVFLENQPNCIAKLRIEVPSDRVRKERAAVAADFQRHARIPGYRPGKAPRPLIETRFAKQIQDELIDKLVRESLSEAIKEKKLNVLAVSKVEGTDLAADDTLKFQATAILAPEFELPDYSKIPAEIEQKPVGDSDVDEMLERFREPHASFVPVEGRAAQEGDFAVLTYAATLDGKPLAEAAENVPPQLSGRRNGWLHLAKDSLLPGFSEQLIGMEIGSEKVFPITLPTEFGHEALAGKTIEYKAELHSLNARNVPELDDALADKIEPGATVTSLRERIETRLKEAAEHQFENDKRRAAIKHLLTNTQFELPEDYVAKEARGILNDIVRENQARGISDEELRKHQDELVGAAQESARDRVRSNFLLARIASQEKLEATEADLTALVMELAYRYEIPVKKFVTDLKKRGGIAELQEQVLARKALDLLSANVTVTPPAAAPAKP